MNFFSSVVISVSSTSFDALALRESLEENFSYISSLGFEGVELAIRNPDLIDSEKILKLLARYDLKVPAIGTGQAYVDEGLSLTSDDKGLRKKAEQRLRAHLKLAREFSSYVIVGLIRGNPEKERLKRAWLFLEKSLDRLCEYAQKIGARGFLLEPLNRYETSLINRVDEAIELIEKIKTKKRVIRILLDSFHSNIEERDIKETILNSKDYLGHIHIADSNRLAPGQGHLDFSMIFNALEKISYRGWVSAEVLAKPTPREAVRLTADFLAKFGLLRRVQK